MRISDIEWAIENCDRHFYVIIGKFEQEEDKKKGKSSYDVKRDMIMKITDFDNLTGEFRAESIKT